MSVSDLTERCWPLVARLHPMSPENGTCLPADLDQLYSDMFAAGVDDDTHRDALKLLIGAIVVDIDDDGIRDVIGWWHDLSRGKLRPL